MLELLSLSYPNVRRKLKGLGIRGQSGSVKFEPQTTGNVPTLLSLLVLFLRLTFCVLGSITKTLQLPVEGGHEGGRVVVRHRSEENLFDLAESSSPCFYLTASYSNCAPELEEVTFGLLYWPSLSAWNK